jgi:hypothetical protein
LHYSIDALYPVEGGSLNTAKSLRSWPYSAAASTGTGAGNAETLLCAILAGGRLDEISNADGSIKHYLHGSGHADESGHLQSGVIFWVYPTGANGPYEKLGDGSILKHGLLLTVERGASVADALRRAETAFPLSGISHEHVARASYA